MSTTTFRRIAAHYIYYRRSLLRSPILSLSSNGTVTGLEFCDEPDSREGVEFYPGILIPGMVNAHCHLELSYLKGAIPEGGGFTAFAAGMSKTRNNYTHEERIAAAEAADDTMWRGGIAAVADICNGASTFGIKGRSPIYYHNFLELYGLEAASAEALAGVAAQSAAAGLDFTLTPHSTYSLNTAAFAAAVRGFSGDGGSGHGVSMRRLSGKEVFENGGFDERAPREGSVKEGFPGQELAGNDASDRRHFRQGISGEELARQAGHPLSIHFMESEDEELLFAGRGDMAEWYARRGLRADFLRFGSPADRIIAQIPPERDIMLIHNCHVTEEVVDKIEAHFTGRVTWVLCPRSNRYISRIEPPYGLLRRKGVRIAVGTDSLASNRSLDLLEELRMFRGVPLEELLSWAVDNGAEALGVSDRLGAFEVGKRCGAVLLQGIDWDNMALTPESRIRRIL